MNNKQLNNEKTNEFKKSEINNNNNENTNKYNTLDENINNPLFENNMSDTFLSEKTYNYLKLEKTDLKKKKKPLIILIIIIVFLISILLYPFIKDNLLITPEKVYKSAIDNINYLINKEIDENYPNNYNIKITTTTNNENKKEYNDYSYGYIYNTDPSNNFIESKLYMLDKTGKEYSYTTYSKNSKIYQKLSSYEKLIILDNNKFKTSIINNNDLKYLINKISSTLKDNLNKQNFSKESAVLNINNTKIKTIKHTYNIDNNEAHRILKNILNDLYQDPNTSRIIKETYNITNSQFLNIINSKITNTNRKFNIYIRNGKCLGFDIEENNQTAISYYNLKDNYNFTLFDGKKNILSVNKEKTDDKSLIEVNSEKEKIATLNIKKLNKRKAKLDYEIYNGFGENFNGKISLKKENNIITGNILIENGLTKVNLSLNIDENKTQTPIINENNSIKLTDEEYNKVIEEFIKSLENTPLGNLITSSNNM